MNILGRLLWKHYSVHESLGGDEAQARAEMQTLANFRQECQHWNDFTKYDTFLGYERTARDAIYIRSYTINTLIQEEDLADDNGLVDLLASVEHIPYVHTAGCTGVLVGGKNCFILLFTN